MGPPGGLQEFNFIVPTGKTGLIIGKGNISYLCTLYVTLKATQLLCLDKCHATEMCDEHDANNAELVCSIPIWTFHFRVGRTHHDPCGSLPTQFVI